MKDRIWTCFSSEGGGYENSYIKYHTLASHYVFGNGVHDCWLMLNPNQSVKPNAMEKNMATGDKYIYTYLT